MEKLATRVTRANPQHLKLATRVTRANPQHLKLATRVTRANPQHLKLENRELDTGDTGATHGNTERVFRNKPTKNNDLQTWTHCTHPLLYIRNISNYIYYLSLLDIFYRESPVSRVSRVLRCSNPKI